MTFHFFVPKRKSKSWEEIREEIIKAIEEEKRTHSPLISISSVGTYPEIKLDKEYSNTASEDAYPLVEKGGDSAIVGSKPEANSG